MIRKNMLINWIHSENDRHKLFEGNARRVFPRQTSDHVLPVMAANQLSRIRDFLRSLPPARGYCRRSSA